MLVGLFFVATLGAIMCVLFQLSQLDARPEYEARHRKPAPPTRLQQLRTRAVARLIIIPQITEPEPSWAAELPAPVLDLDKPPVDRRWDVLAPRALAAEAQLARRSLRLRTLPTAEPGDVWAEPELVSAA